MTTMHPLLRLLTTNPKSVVGLTSSTSLDGIQAVLVEIRGHGVDAEAQLVASQVMPLPPGLSHEIARALTPDGALSAAELSALSFRLGGALGDAALAIAGDHPIDLVGSHGHTVWHQSPWMKSRRDLVASTLQLGEPAMVAARTQAVTVGDFRVADMAVGGAGAPLSPYANWVLFRPRVAGKVRALQDIGSKSSICVVGEQLADVFAFDNGPGSLVLDALLSLVSDPAAIDHDFTGPTAAGRVNETVLAELMDDDFLRRPPPKSGALEHFGKFFVERLRGRYARIRPVDLLATMVLFVAEAIAQSIRTFILPHTPVDEVLVSGGGAQNRVLISQIAERLSPLPVRAFAEAGIPAESKSAMTFALLAVEAVHAGRANIVQATGARRPAVLGKICLPPG